MHLPKTILITITMIVLFGSIGLLYSKSPENFYFKDQTQLRHNTRTFFHGRKYFFLRSGRALMILQSDKADVGPAITYWLFDAGTPSQSGKKSKAFNFNRESGSAFSSALRVIIKDVPFAPFGERTSVRWVTEDNVPMVEGVWWADGIRVTERFAGLPEKESFQRSIFLEGADLAGEVEITLRLMMPFGNCTVHGAVLSGRAGDAPVALTASAGYPAQFNAKEGSVEIGPIKIHPQQKIKINSFLLLQLPAESQSSAQIVTRAQALLKNGDAVDLKRAKQKWASMSTLQTEDKVVQEIYDHARYSLDNFATEDGRINAGYLQYGSEWIRDGSCTALGALMAGNFEMARAMGNHMLTKMITEAGATMIGGAFVNPDREQLDQMGEMLHFLRCYVDWTGDESLIRQNRNKILAMIERPLNPVFLDETGMVHNRREFWERTFDDAYELIYQTYVILGLREACRLAPLLGATDKVERWQKVADRMLMAMLSHPDRALVHEGRLIKRRNVTGEIADYFTGYGGTVYDCPQKVTLHHRLLPDATQALPIAFRVIDPHSDLARNTLEEMEQLWNARWSGGGYCRYNSSGEPNQVGPWAFATCFIMRAQHEARLFKKSRRALEYLHSIPGGQTGAWLEEVPATKGTTQWDGFITWSSGEMTLFIIRHYLGLRFEDGELVIQPALYPGSPPLTADIRVRSGRLHLQINGSGAIKEAIVNGKTVMPGTDGAIRLGRDAMSGTVVIRTK
ncbi:MAG: hypothetical protein GXO75_19070 [Calditrichaeota bacterium]|nr:hypothetical protein [Calditrichota bacterium]